MKLESFRHPSLRLIEAVVLTVDNVEKTRQESIAHIDKTALSVTQTKAMISKTREILRPDLTRVPPQGGYPPSVG